MYYCSLCLIVRDDHAYIREWVDYYLMIGVDHFYITDHKSSPPLEGILHDYIVKGLITYVYDERSHPQIEVYNECIRKYADASRWIGFFDSDEFLVLKQHQTIKEFLTNYETYGAVSIGWYLFGSSGHIEKQNSIVKSYTYRFPNSSHYKTIVQPKTVLRYAVHHVEQHDEGYFTVDENKNRINGPFNQTSTLHSAQLNHYIVRSRRDFEDKMAKGCADGASPRTWEFFDIVNAHATVYDDLILSKINK